VKIVLAAPLCALAAPALAQSLEVTGLDGRTCTLTTRELAASPQARVPLKAHDGPEKVYEGATLADVIQAVGAPTGRALRGGEMADVVMVGGKDGYRVAFGLAEINPGIGAKKVIIAAEADGKPLVADEGPLRLVVEGDLRPARSVRMVTNVRPPRPGPAQ
jgi:DMSO/TMAO reductase YedYZ molybdopterin-dependent catalytic subunit